MEADRPFSGGKRYPAGPVSLLKYCSETRGRMYETCIILQLTNVENCAKIPVYGAGLTFRGRWREVVRFCAEKGNVPYRKKIIDI